MKRLNYITFLEQWADQAFPWELTWSQWPAHHEGLYQRTQVLKQKSRNKIKDVGVWKWRTQFLVFLRPSNTPHNPPDLTQLCSVKETSDKWLMSIALWSSPNLQQHQWPPRAMHLSAVIFLKVSQSKWKAYFLPPRHRAAARSQKKDILVLITHSYDYLQ